MKSQCFGQLIYSTQVTQYLDLTGTTRISFDINTINKIHENMDKSIVWIFEMLLHLSGYWLLAITTIFLAFEFDEQYDA
ncbi:hypothetical protein BOTCAL_1038g00020 [Botryotinia calthae]|uniref:Uncharacterized protein n=1 Tax=Botryotinia calthae TaxID=38488 RepID=A0A4Y8CE13_9HELO|nr:hypothetical protein BOTCAL_1038g00020 [Botryotinia calthae]